MISAARRLAAVIVKVPRESDTNRAAITEVPASIKDMAK
jgi:hypothetical protein